MRLRLNIVDTPGYGDQVNNDRWYWESRSSLASELIWVLVGIRS